jgi:HNH endonuclease
MPKRHPIKLLPSQEYLRECFDYDPETGVLAWKRRPREHFPTYKAWARWNTCFANKPAGHYNDRGYRCVHIANILYFTHRVIFKWMTGKEPPKTLDHINGNPGDNRWANLRPATSTQQSWNMNVRRDSASGFRGVRRTRNGRYEAYADRRSLGTFDSAEEASAAYIAAVRQERGDFTR